MEHLELFFKSIFIDNMVFATFLGMCSYLAVSKKVTTAVGLGAAVIFVLAVTVPLNWLLDQYLLQEGALAWLDPKYGVDGSETIDLSFLSFIMFIATIATMVQLVEIVVEKFSPSLYNSLGIYYYWSYGYWIYEFWRNVNRRRRREKEKKYRSCCI